jgi:GT2 family glycosyltransferase
MTDRPRITVVVPTHNEGDNLARAVTSLLTGLDERDQVVVVDDASTDGSADALETIDERVAVVRNETRIGVAASRNTGAACTDTGILFFSDAHVTVPQGWAAALAEPLAMERTGAVGPVLASMHAPDIQGWGLRFCDDATNLEWLPPRGRTAYPVPVLPGAFIGVSRAVFEETGGFDWGMKAYGMEDPEFCTHLWLRGYSCVLVPSVTVKHLFREGNHLPAYQLDWSASLVNVLRFGVVHMGRQRLARLVASYVADPAFPQALAAVFDSDALHRRDWVQASRAYSDDWYFDVCNRPFATG